MKSFDRGRVDPSVLCLSRGLLLEKLTSAGIPNFLIPMKSRKDLLGPLLKTIRLVKERNIDIIHTHTVRSNLIGRPAAFLTNRKCVTHLHSPILRDFVDLRRGRINEIIDSLTRPIAAHYIAVSHSLRKEMIKSGFPSYKISTIHNGLDLDSLKSSVIKNSKNRGIREEYNITGNAFIIVLIALLRPRKGVEVIIKAMKLILRHFPDLHLLIVGSDDISEAPEYGNGLRRLTSEHSIESNVTFTGFRDDVPAILSQCNLMVLSSLFGEGLPMTVLEAMAIGVPVVASRVEGIPEVIEDGVNGFLVNPGDVEQLANRIIEVINNPNLLRNVKDEAQRRALAEMDGKIQAQKVEQVYREIVGCESYRSIWKKV